jgi:uncharacterized protein YjbI with pentapeptide repeats
MPPNALSQPPGWAHCGHGAGTGDPVGCRGIRVTGHAACLAHLDDIGRTAYLSALHPGADIDHRGTPFTQGLLGQLLDAVRSPDTRVPRLGNAWFDRSSFTGHAGFGEATFTGHAGFGGVSFAGHADFRRVTFTDRADFDWVSFAGHADFRRVTFTDRASFRRASFAGHADFRRITFTDRASFRSARFTQDADFDGATFSRDAEFNEAFFAGLTVFTEATFAGDAGFGGVTFTGDVGFLNGRFESASALGPMACGGVLDLRRVVFGAPVTVEAAASKVWLQRARWECPAALGLRYADVDLSGAVLEYPLTLTAEPARFRNGMLEEVLASGDKRVRAVSVSGVDCAHLTLTDVDLSGCRFAGAVHLDQLRLDGPVGFSRPPAGWRRRGPLPLRWSRRQVLIEEHHWRAAARPPAPGEPVSTDAWQPGPYHPDRECTPGPRALAAVYRQLRKALEDGKNEPDAADFYYGEMEMRRHDPTRPHAERAVLAAYWAFSGYGLRASRALTWLGVTMIATVLALMLWGLPTSTPEPEFTGHQTGPDISLTTTTPDPANPTGPLLQRLTTERFEKGLRVVINSVVFRSSGQDLTTTGTYTEMASRFTEPILLGLALLAIRARVKR